MATKTVTLKDSNGDTLYPVTDSNVVNINQQKTLAQALDGVVYAEDPTTQAQPTAWVTNSDIDWSTMPGSYSTTEQKTPFTWVDGRPIYKKTISCGGGSNQHKAVNHNVSNLRRTIKIDGQAYDGNVCIPIPFVATGDGTYTSIQVYVSSTQVIIECGTDRDNLTEMYITLYYTKTTA